MPRADGRVLAKDKGGQTVLAIAPCRSLSYTLLVVRTSRVALAQYQVLSQWYISFMVICSPHARAGIPGGVLASWVPRF